MKTITICLGLASLIIGVVGTAISVRTAPVDPLGGDRLIKVKTIGENEDDSSKDDSSKEDFSKEDFSKEEFSKEEFSKEEFSKGDLDKEDDWADVGTL